jgi:hypothetical protein
MITQEIYLVEKVSNGDGTTSMIAELAVFKDGIFSHHDSRSPFTFADTMTDQDIKDYLTANEYSRYF